MNDPSLCANGHLMAGSDLFCGQCGAPAESDFAPNGDEPETATPTDGRTCPDGHPNPEGNTFCGTCGSKTELELSGNVRTSALGTTDGPRPWWRSPLAAIAAAVLAMGGLVGVINLASGSNGDSDTSVSAASEQLDEDPAPAPTEPLLNDCEVTAESIFSDMDAGYSHADIYASYGGMQDRDTQHFVELYSYWQAWALQMGRDAALEQVFDDVTTWCNGGAVEDPADSYPD